MPPWVASTTLSPELRHRLRGALLALNADAQARQALQQADVQGFAPVDDAAYGPIRQMSRSAERYPLPVTRAA